MPEPKPPKGTIVRHGIDTLLRQKYDERLSYSNFGLQTRQIMNYCRYRSSSTGMRNCRIWTRMFIISFRRKVTSDFRMCLFVINTLHHLLSQHYATKKTDIIRYRPYIMLYCAKRWPESDSPKFSIEPAVRW